MGTGYPQHSAWFATKKWQTTAGHWVWLTFLTPDMLYDVTKNHLECEPTPNASIFSKSSSGSSGYGSPLTRN